MRKISKFIIVCFLSIFTLKSVDCGVDNECLSANLDLLEKNYSWLDFSLLTDNREHHELLILYMREMTKILEDYYKDTSESNRNRIIDMALKPFSQLANFYKYDDNKDKRSIYNYYKNYMYFGDENYIYFRDKNYKCFREFEPRYKFESKNKKASVYIAMEDLLIVGITNNIEKFIEIAFEYFNFFMEDDCSCNILFALVDQCPLLTDDQSTFVNKQALSWINNHLFYARADERRRSVELLKKLINQEVPEAINFARETVNAYKKAKEIVEHRKPYSSLGELTKEEIEHIGYSFGWRLDNGTIKSLVKEIEDAIAEL